MHPDALARALRDAAFVVVQAPAGYGKTTSVQAVLAGEPGVAWYDAQPWEAGAFAAALLERVRPERPDVGRLTLALAEQGADFERLGATFAEDLRHVDAPLRIVVDDAHVLGPTFAGFARGLVGRMPAAVRLVLLTRVPLDVGLPEAVAAGRGALVDAGSLRFDLARTRALADALGTALDTAQMQALLARTEGWPIAVALALRAPAASDVLLDELVARRIDALDAADRELLEAVAAYETVEPVVASPGDAAMEARLAGLAADASLVAAVRDGFRVHPLVREALVRRMSERDLAALHASAARAYSAAGRLRPALFHLDRTHDAGADVTFLRAHASAAVASGLLDGVRAALARVRAAGIDEPALVALTGGLLAKARGDDGRGAFAEAVREADRRGDTRLAFDARLQWVEGDLAHGEPVDSLRVDDLLARAPAQGPVALGKAIVRAGWADAVVGDFPRALARLDALPDAGDPAVAADVAPLAAYAHVALGEFEEAERIANGLIETWASGDDLVRYAGALVWAARFALLRGETTAALELVREGERIARPFGLRSQAAALHATLAEAALHAGETAAARREARAALRSADTAWYARDAQRARTLGSRILARADALDGNFLAALAASGENDAASLADAALFSALAGARDAVERRERARAALAQAIPVDGADAVALWSSAEALDALDAFEGRSVETPLRSTPFEGLIARRAEPPGPRRAAAARRSRRGGVPDLERIAVAAGFRRHVRASDAPRAAFRDAPARSARRAAPRRSSGTGAGGAAARSAHRARARDPRIAGERADQPGDRAAPRALRPDRRDARRARHRQARRQFPRPRRRPRGRARHRRPAGRRGLSVPELLRRGILRAASE